VDFLCIFGESEQSIFGVLETQGQAPKARKECSMVATRNHLMIVGGLDQSQKPLNDFCILDMGEKNSKHTKKQKQKTLVPQISQCQSISWKPSIVTEP
jgi:hypothetical protein